MKIKAELSFFLLTIPLLFLFLVGKGQAYYPLDFVENKGQWEGDFSFRAEAGDGAIFIDPRGYTILQHHPEDFKKLSERLHGHGAAVQGGGDPHLPAVESARMMVRSHAVKVFFQGSANKPEVMPEGQREGYDNYFLGNDPAKWKSEVRSFSTLRFRDVYPGIDVKYYTESGQLKYDFIVKPGADISRIQLKYEGAERISVKNGDLLVQTSVEW